MEDQSTVIVARPTPFEFDPSATAVVVVDMQNDFGSRGGMFDRAGIDIAEVQAIVPNIREVLGAARASGVLVVYLKMAFQPDLADSGYPSSPTWLKHAPFKVGSEVTSPAGEPSRTLIRDTWSTDIVPDLTPQPDDLVVYKSRFSGFFGTELHEILQQRGVQRLIVVGATTSVCVDSTVRDAMFRDYHCLVVSDATAEPIAADAPRSNHEASLLTFELLFAHVATTADVVAALSATAALPA
ncbi:cysteine hydrolase [Nocardioides gansuensis]|uniref:Cysteine hydrolase n=1 Tax=Nocardioides gansuensis TaxID=2138300 RepID=A0A2T8F4I2_9ACTN|nr:cysteine hydrolase [Nocardioides gansuensis]PVG80625.1 cysteine hydrolase [Nocardioides gansuensis]